MGLSDALFVVRCRLLVVRCSLSVDAAERSRTTDNGERTTSFMGSAVVRGHTSGGELRYRDRLW